MEGPVIETTELSKTYKSGFQALDNVNISIEPGEIFSLLGPNGAGKTTLISIICGIVNKTTGRVLIGGKDIVQHYRETRSLIGLVPQELTTDAFDTVWNAVNFSRGLFGKPPNPNYITKLLKDLSLWDHKDKKLMMLSGGMKRRLMIAKALSHEPKVLFLDEPSAGVDVALRKDMWRQVRDLRRAGVTIILTTHYIEEAEEMADRVGIINHGKLIHIEKKADLMRNLGTKKLIIELAEKCDEMPPELVRFNLAREGSNLIYQYDPKSKANTTWELITALNESSLVIRDIETKNSTLEEIFVGLVNE